MKLLKPTTISLESQRHRTTPLTRFRERPLLQPFSLIMIKGLKVTRISLFVVCTAKSRITPLHAKESPIHKSAEKFFKEKTCFVCLSFGHRGHECRSTKTCRNCKQRHHQSICGGFNTPLNTGTTVPVIEERTPDSSEVITSTTSGRNERVLLQIARAFATNEDGTKSTPVRVLFDNGSQRSYVTNNLKSNLNLKPYKTETLHLNTFGEQRYRKQSCEVVKLRLHKSGHEEIEITALSFPVICSSVSSKIDIRKFPHLECLELADDFDNEGGDSIDIHYTYWC